MTPHRDNRRLGADEPPAGMAGMADVDAVLDAALAAARPGDPEGVAVAAAHERIRGRVRLRGGDLPRRRSLRVSVAAVLCLAVGALAWLGLAGRSGERAMRAGDDLSVVSPSAPGRPGEALSEAALSEAAVSEAAVSDQAAPEQAAGDADGQVAGAGAAAPDASAGDAAEAAARGPGVWVEAALAGDGVARQRLREGGVAAVRALATAVQRGAAPGAAAALRRRMTWTLDAAEVEVYATALALRGRLDDGALVAELLWARGGLAGADALAGVLMRRDDLAEPIVQVVRSGSRRAPWARVARALMPAAKRSPLALAALLRMGRPEQLGAAATAIDAGILQEAPLQAALANLDGARRQRWLRRAEDDDPTALHIVAAAAWPEGRAVLERVARGDPDRAWRALAVRSLERMTGVESLLALARLGFDEGAALEVSERARRALAARVPLAIEALERVARRQHGLRWAASSALSEGGEHGRLALLRLAQRGTTRRQAILALGVCRNEAASDDLGALAEAGGAAAFESIAALVARLERSPAAERVLWSLLAGRHADEVATALAAAHGDAVEALEARMADDPIRGARARRWRDTARRPRSGGAAGVGPAARAAGLVPPSAVDRRRPPY